MNQKEKLKRAIVRKRRAKTEKELYLLAIGAGLYWQGGGYWEYQDDCEKCLGQFMAAVSEQYDLKRDSIVFSFYRFKEWSHPRTLAKLIDNEIQWKKECEKREREADGAKQ
jgi:hypothetical protein